VPWLSPGWWRAVLREPWQQAGFGLYLHWPFCQSKCPYCDFNSHVAERIDPEEWIRAYCREIRRCGDEIGPRVLRSIYFGGGTPSLMDPTVVGAVIDAAASEWNLSNDIEITLEANPGSVEAGRFRGYREAGVNRVSLGVQALDDRDLHALGRLHTVDDALAALEVAREAFARVSFDLIYARQNQPLAGWERELRRALSFSPDHLSLYQLTIEDGTAFGRRHGAGKLAGLPDEDLAADMFELTQELTAHAGLPAYEISNHAGIDARSRHNLIYWQGGDWVGIGPGAHGRLTLDGRRVATETALRPALWLQAALAGNGETSRIVLDPADAAREYLMMGLRLVDGVRVDAIPPLMGELLSHKSKDLVNDGLLESSAGRLRATGRGRQVLNAVLVELLGSSAG